MGTFLIAALLVSGVVCLADGAALSRVVLLGDSTAITSYLPEDQKHSSVLQRKLDERFGAGAAEVVNWADNGEFIARFLLNGSYEKFRSRIAGADLFLIRFGINDEKRYSPPDFGAQLQKLIDLLTTDFPDAKLIVETGVYADPAHFSSDRNRYLNPYWEQARRIAKERNLPLCDIYLAMEKETQAGNWDLRIRRTEPGVPYVFDASQDEAQAALGKGWFTNIHPNPEGVRVAAITEASLLAEVFPNGLPKGGRKIERPAKTGAEYEALLGVGRESLVVRSKRDKDGLQKPVQP